MTLQAWSKVIAHMYKHMKCKWILCLVLAPIRKRPHYVFVNISKSTKVLSPRCFLCPAFWIRNLKIPSIPFYIYHPSIPYLSLAALSAPHLSQAASTLRALISSHVQFFSPIK